VRISVLIKQGARELYRLVYPHAIAPVKLGGKVLSQDTLNGIRALFFLYIGIFLLASLAVSFLGADIITSVSAVATTIGNTGPGNFAHLPAASKWILTACMLFGRLEIYTLLILLFPEF
jgi:trk system potassium uptake protein TrkH